MGITLVQPLTVKDVLVVRRRTRKVRFQEFGSGFLMLFNEILEGKIFKAKLHIPRIQPLFVENFA